MKSPGFAATASHALREGNGRRARSRTTPSVRSISRNGFGWISDLMPFLLTFWNGTIRAGCAFAFPVFASVSGPNLFRQKSPRKDFEETRNQLNLQVTFYEVRRKGGTRGRVNIVRRKNKTRQLTERQLYRCACQRWWMITRWWSFVRRRLSRGDAEGKRECEKNRAHRNSTRGR